MYVLEENHFDTTKKVSQCQKNHIIVETHQQGGKNYQALEKYATLLAIIHIMLTMTDDTPGPASVSDATATADDTREEGLILNIPPAKHTAASLLTKRSSTKKTLDKYDLDGNGEIDSEEAQLMAKDLNAANKQVVEVEKDKNSKYSTIIDFI